MAWTSPGHGTFFPMEAAARRAGGILATILLTILSLPRPAAAEPPKSPASRLADEGAPAPHDPEAGPTETLTLEAALAAALRDSPDVHAAEARLANAAARLQEAQARYAPTVFFAHQSVRFFQTPDLNGRLGGILESDGGGVLDALGSSTFADLSANTNSFSEHAMGWGIGWLVFDGWIREATVRAARHAREAAGHSLDDVRRILSEAVQRAYHQLQGAEERIRIAQADENFSREQLEVTQKMRDAGRATAADVDNFRIRVLAAKSAVSMAYGLRDTGRTILAELMGAADANLPSRMRLAVLTEESPAEMAAPDAESWLADAQRLRPDLHQWEELTRSEEEKVRAAKGLYWPVVSVGGFWGYSRASNLGYESDDQLSAAGLEFQWELYSGQTRRSKIVQAESARAETAAQFNRKRLAVVSEVRQAIVEVVIAQEQIVLNRERVLTAAENRRLIQTAYEAGKESLTRLNEAQRDFINADVALAQARIRLRQAWGNLYAAAGRAGTLDGTN